MRRNLLLSVCFLMASVLFAGPVTKQQAQEMAKIFIQNRLAAGGGHRASANSQIDLSGEVSGLYVFNVDKDNGYVIVSNDDCAEPVLGYADKGSFDMQNIPENMRAWLQGYADEIAWAKSHHIKKGSTTARRTGGVKSVIAPLMVTQWNQTAPYNNQCPSGCVTGCVATAMAQVMKYNHWPENDILKVIPAYSTDFGSSSVRVPLNSNLPVVTFDWENMLPSYSGSESNEQKAAVAQLMYYCGCSVRMDYGSSSSATTSKAADALKEYFDYATTTESKNRSYYSYTNWIELLYHELEEGRVVLYSGSSTGGGHAFVVDGYQSEDYFHVNWGWGGSSDGHFKLSALTPSNQGAGGSSSTDGYNYLQGAIVGIQKNEGTGTVLNLAGEPNLTVNSVTLNPSTVAVGETTQVTFNVTNNGTTTYDGDLYVYVNGIGLKIGKNFIIPAKTTQNCTIPYTPTGYTGTVSIMAAVPRPTGGSWYYYDNHFENLTVNSASVGGTDNVDLTMTISVEKAEDRNSLVYYDTGHTVSSPSYNLTGNDFKATVHLTNGTVNDYAGRLYWCLNPNGESASIFNEEVSVPANSSKDISIVVNNLDYNKPYIFEAGYVKNGSYSLPPLGYYILQRGITTYDSAGNKTITNPSGTTLDVSSSDALAFDVTGTSITSITPNSKPNAVYIYSGSSIPIGLDGKNVIKYDGGNYTAETINLTDNNDFYSPVDFTATKVEFTYIFTTGADGTNGWNTIMLPFDVAEVTANGTAIDWFHSSSDTGKQFWVKKFVGDGVSTVDFDFTSEMKANTPYIVAFPGNHWGEAYNLSGKTIKFIGNNVTVHQGGTLSSVAGANYRFIGNTVQDNTANIYGINATGSSFVLKSTGGSAPFRAYFKPGIFDSSVTSLGIGNGGNTTGIVEMKSEKIVDSDNYYNLNGQRVSQPSKGLYIKNGKKFVIK